MVADKGVDYGDFLTAVGGPQNFPGFDEAESANDPTMS
jgi:hypothetical protein